MLTRKMNLEMLSLPDCEGLSENGKCRRLNTPSCIGNDCSFYQRVSSLDRANKRLCSLDESTQKHISKKYYGGFRPWLKSLPNVSGDSYV